MEYWKDLANQLYDESIIHTQGSLIRIKVEIERF